MNVKKETEKKKNRAKYGRQIQLEKKKKMDDEIKLQVSMMTRKMRGELSRVIRELSPLPLRKGYYIRLFPLFHVLSLARNLALSEKICELAGSSLLFTVKPNTGQCIRHRIP